MTDINSARKGNGQKSETEAWRRPPGSFQPAPPRELIYPQRCKGLGTTRESSPRPIPLLIKSATGTARFGLPAEPTSGADADAHANHMTRFKVHGDVDD